MLAQDPLLPPIDVELADAGYLDDEQVPDEGLTAKVIYPDLQFGDQVEAYWYSVGSGGRISDWSARIELTPNDPSYDPATSTLTFKVSKTVITAAAGGQGFFHWRLMHSGDPEFTYSPRLRLEIGRLPPVVQVRQSHQLQIGLPSGSTTEVVGPVFVSLQVGDKAILHAVRDGSSKAYTLEVEAKHLGQPLTWALEKSFLLVAQQLKKTVDLHLELVLGSNPGTSVAFARQRFTVVKLEDLPPGEKPVELPGMAAKAEGLTIDPVNFPAGLQVRVPLTGVVERADVVLLRALGARGTDDVRIQVIADITMVKTGAWMVTLPQAWLLAHDGQDVTFEWQVDRVGANFSGEPLVVQVQSARVLESPIVPGATPESPVGDVKQGYVRADQVTSGLFVKVPDEVTVREGEVLTLHYDGDPAGGQYQTSVPVSGETHRFLIPPQYLAPNMGPERKRAPVYYTITPPAGAVIKSKVYQLLVKPLSSQALLNIRCPQAESGDPVSLRNLIDNHGGQADIIQPAWAFMAPGQRVVMTASGVSPVDTELTCTLFDDAAPGPGELEAKLPVSFLNQLKLNEQFTIYVEVAFDTQNFILRQNTSLRLVA